MANSRDKAAAENKNLAFACALIPLGMAVATAQLTGGLEIFVMAGLGVVMLSCLVRIGANLRKARR
ncbi:hypothetical protein [Streptomyces europaeiscabiei]|uniref:hypothetical protein n=1 Tax=Streptomyces europaeiscabiei TaxID=146819 RepID=UPI002E291D21|nr:hypothetical protein [Streptomyces europaeiscabiei]